MATPDFNKIWATNSPLTKYEFTDENYLTGWNFIGSIPPARSMFDTLQKNTDEKLKWLFDESATQKNLTVDDTSAPTSNTAKLLALINNLANMEKQIKGDSDWKTAPGTNLATLATLVSNLASGSDVTWSGKKFTNAKLGITGLIDQNGYLSFGPNFGGLIIQWGLFFNANGLSPIIYPIALSSKPWAIITTEGNPAGWNTSNGIAIAGGDIATASNTQANILSKWVLNGGTVEQGGQSVLVLIIGV